MTYFSYWMLIFQSLHHPQMTFQQQKLDDKKKIVNGQPIQKPGRGIEGYRRFLSCLPPSCRISLSTIKQRGDMVNNFQTVRDTR
jgi:hypothetical protein